MAAFRKTSLWFLAAFLAVFATYQLSLEYSLSSDSWYLLAHPEMAFHQHSSTARPFSALLQAIWDRTGMNIVKEQFWTGLASIFLLAVTVTVLFRGLVLRHPARNLLTALLVFVAAFLIVCNPFMAEWFTFSFITPMECLAELLAILAALVLASTRLTPVRSLVFLMLSVAVATLFQSPLSLTLPVAIVLLAIDNRPLQLILRRVALGLAGFISGGLACLLYVRYVHPHFSRLIDNRTSRLDLSASLKAVLDNQKPLWVDAFTLMPRYVLMVAILSGIALLFLSRAPLLTKFLILGASAAAGLLALGPHLITAIVWIVPRSVTSIASIPGLLLLGSVWFLARQGPLRILTCGFAVFLAMMTIGECNRILSDNLFNYREDRTEALTACDRIAALEQTQGVHVTKLAFAFDRAPLWCYPDAHCYGDLNVRASVKAFARLPLFATACERPFQEIPFRGTVRAMFGNDNWDRFSPQQIRVVGDTAYIAIY